MAASDRRHIHDEDARKIIQNSPIPVNLECSINQEIIDIACELQPHRITLVPEKREEVTTEGGLDVAGQSKAISYAIEQLHDAIIPVSLFIDPTIEAVTLSKELNAEMVELHTNLKSPLGKMLLANTITLTPGTLTVDVDGDKLQVHWVYCPPGTDTGQATALIAASIEKRLARFLL